MDVKSRIATLEAQNEELRKVSTPTRTRSATAAASHRFVQHMRAKANPTSNHQDQTMSTATEVPSSTSSDVGVGSSSFSSANYYHSSRNRLHHVEQPSQHSISHPYNGYASHSSSRWDVGVGRGGSPSNHHEVTSIRNSSSLSLVNSNSSSPTAQTLSEGGGGENFPEESSTMTASLIRKTRLARTAAAAVASSSSVASDPAPGSLMERRKQLKESRLRQNYRLSPVNVTLPNDTMTITTSRSSTSGAVGESRPLTAKTSTTTSDEALRRNSFNSTNSNSHGVVIQNRYHDRPKSNPRPMPSRSSSSVSPSKDNRSHHHRSRSASSLSSSNPTTSVNPAVHSHRRFVHTISAESCDDVNHTTTSTASAVAKSMNNRPGRSDKMGNKNDPGSGHASAYSITASAATVTTTFASKSYRPEQLAKHHRMQRMKRQQQEMEKSLLTDSQASTYQEDSGGRGDTDYYYGDTDYDTREDNPLPSQQQQQQHPPQRSNHIHDDTSKSTHRPNRSSSNLQHYQNRGLGNGGGGSASATDDEDTLTSVRRVVLDHSRQEQQQQQQQQHPVSSSTSTAVPQVSQKSSQQSPAPPKQRHHPNDGDGFFVDLLFGKIEKNQTPPPSTKTHHANQETGPKNNGPMAYAEEKSDKERSPPGGETIKNQSSSDDDDEDASPGRLFIKKQQLLREQQPSLSSPDVVATTPDWTEIPDVNGFFSGSRSSGLAHHSSSNRGDEEDSNFDYAINNNNSNLSPSSLSYAERQRREAERKSSSSGRHADNSKHRDGGGGNMDGEGPDSPLLTKDDLEHFRQQLNNPATKVAAGVAGCAALGCLAFGPVGLLLGPAAVGIGVGIMQIPEEQRNTMRERAAIALESAQQSAMNASDTLSQSCAISYKDSTTLADHLPPDVSRCFTATDDALHGDDRDAEHDDDNNNHQHLLNGTTVSTNMNDNNSHKVATTTAGNDSQASVAATTTASMSGQRKPNSRNGGGGGGGVSTTGASGGLDRINSSSSPQSKIRNHKVACLKTARIIPLNQIHALDPSNQPKAWLDVLASATTTDDEKHEAMEEILILAKDKRRARIFLEEGILDSMMWIIGRYFEKTNRKTMDHNNTSNPWAHPEVTARETASAKLAAACCVTLGKAHCAAIHTEGDLLLMSLYERGTVPEDRQLAQMLFEIPHHARVTKTNDPTIVDPAKEVFAMKQLTLPQAEELARNIKALADSK